MNCLIVDDENLAVQIISDYCSKIPGLTIAATCDSALKAIDILHTKKIDLMFLDIQMPDFTGLDMLRSMKIEPMVILTTAYSEYAIKGYEFDVVDYLLKPIPFERFVQAVNKASERFMRKEPRIPLMAHEEKSVDEFFFVKANHKLIKVEHKSILYIEGLKEYVIIQQKNAKVITLMSMKSLEESLPAESFIRVHKSFIVAKALIKAIDGNLIEIEDKLIPIGKNYRENVMKELGI